MTIYDEDLRPRVLIAGVAEAQSDIVDVVEQYSGTARVIREVAPAIRWESWDALVSVGAPFNWQSHLFMIQIGGDPHGSIRSPSGQSFRSIRLCESYGTESVVNGELEGSLKDVVKSELVPLIREWAPPRNPMRDPGFSRESSYFIPLVSDLDGNAFAAIYRPDGGAREVIYLPDVVTDIRPWLLYAFERWAAEERDTFPVAPDWTDVDTWMTAEEIDARRVWAESQAAAEDARREAERLEQASLKELRALRDKADRFERVLLTGSGDPLVQAVASALTRLGFTVQDRDALGHRERLEDLRVHDGEWIALCEVKGYTKGGTPTDMGKIGRFVERYMQETHGVAPDSRWYVVNQFKDRDPSSRKELLRGQDGDVEVFAESNGLAIDTRSLFLLDKAVVNGEIDKDEARTLLREAVGRFGYGL